MNFEMIPPGGGPGETLPVLEGLNAHGKETVGQITSDSFGQIIADRNPAVLWCVILVRKKYNGKIKHGITYARLPRDDAKRLACLCEVTTGFVVGAFWLNPNGEQFGYQLLSIASAYFRDKKARDGLLKMIQKLLEVEFGGKRVMCIDDAFE
jgi:hypothetical protein